MVVGFRLNHDFIQFVPRLVWGRRKELNDPGAF
jgi:hypothetical protein